MKTPRAEEVARALVLAGARDLPPASRAWIVRYVDAYGLPSGSPYVPCAEPSAAIDSAISKLERRSRSSSSRGSAPTPTGTPPVGAIEQGARVLVTASRRFGRVPPLTVVGGTVLPLYQLPWTDAAKKYVELRADWLALQEQAGPGGVEQYNDLTPDVAEWHQFLTDWDNGAIDNSDIAGRLNAEVVRVNRVRATLIEHQTGKTTFVQDLPDPTKNIDTVQATPGGSTAQAVDDWAKKHPIIDSLTNPAGPAIPTPWGKLPGGILGGLAIIGGTLLVGNQVLGALVRKAIG